MIEEELEILYDAYYDELENFAHSESGKYLFVFDDVFFQSCDSVSMLRRLILFVIPRFLIGQEHPHAHTHEPIHDHYDDDDEYSDDDDEEDDESSQSGGGSIFEFGSSLAVKGMILMPLLRLRR